MHVISRKILREFSDQYPDAETRLDSWYRLAQKAEWRTPADVRVTYGNASFVEDFVVFNIKGNDYRLIVKINYKSQTLFIKHVLTREDYDKNDWKSDWGKPPKE